MNSQLMIEKIHERARKFEWIGKEPLQRKSIVLLVPQYNENSNSDLDKRLSYYDNVALMYRDLLDVVIIDDGSTDNSLNKIKNFQQNNDTAFYVASVSPNAQKVGALYLAVLSLHHEYIILSDFDTDIIGVEKMFRIIEMMKQDRDLMGCYFRMLPYEGKGGTFLFQQLEYSIYRCLYKFHRKDGSVPVMPGAGSCYKKSILISIYNEHSGLRNGEDREATLLGLKLGYKTFYAEEVLTLTRPPLSFWALVNQRIRWNLGYIETFDKEKQHYFSEMTKLNSIGTRTLMDAVVIAFYVILPFLVAGALLISWKLAVALLIAVYIAAVMLPINALLMSPKESVEFKDKRLYSLLYYPMYKISLDCFAWSGALLKFLKMKRRAKALATASQTS